MFFFRAHLKWGSPPEFVRGLRQNRRGARDLFMRLFSDPKGV